MQTGALRALEFDRIVDAVRRLATTPMGQERLMHLAPSTDPQKVAHLLAATTETAHYIAKNGLFPLQASPDLPQILDTLAVHGRALEAGRLLSFASFLDSIEETRQPLSRAAQHRGDQQRHRRARGAGSRGSAAHPAGIDGRVPLTTRRPSADGRSGHRA